MNEPSNFKETNLDKTYQQALSALVDNELPDNERKALLDQAVNDSEANERINHYHAQNAALKALFPIQEEKVRTILIPSRMAWKRQAGIAAAWLTLGSLLGLAPGWLSPYLTGQPAFARNADIAYTVYAPEQRHPVEVVAADETHLINWLSKRLNRPLIVPSLQQYGYALMGGRLLPGETGPAAQFMYEDKAGNRLTLYVTAASKNIAAIRMLYDANKQGTFYWVDEGMGYALSGRASKADLRSMAIAVCDALGGNSKIWQ
ncbi:MAG TPA: anti-sigma factor [Eoetvoesiella sp.]